MDVTHFSTQTVVINTENCKLELTLDCSTTRMEKNIHRMSGIEKSSRRRGFADFAIQVFYNCIRVTGLSLALRSLSLIDCPFLQHMRGRSLHISLSNGCCSIKCQSFMRICFKFGTAGWYCVTKGKIRYPLVFEGVPVS